MSTDSMHSVVLLDEKELQELTREVKETIAQNAMIIRKTTRKFTAAQMWNIKRRGRSAAFNFPVIRVVD